LRREGTYRRRGAEAISKISNSLTKDDDLLMIASRLMLEKTLNFLRSYNKIQEVREVERKESVRLECYPWIQASIASYSLRRCRRTSESSARVRLTKQVPS
jgi:hypothetical protein